MSDVSIQILAAAQSISTYAHEQMRWIAEKSEDQAVQQECYLFAEAIDRAVHELVSPFASDIRGYLDQVAPSAPPPPLTGDRTTMELPNLRRSVAAHASRRPPSALGEANGSDEPPFPSVSSMVAGDLGKPLVDLDLEEVAAEVAAEVRWS